jgi:hypothetical protein
MSALQGRHCVWTARWGEHRQRMERVNASYAPKENTPVLVVCKYVKNVPLGHTRCSLEPLNARNVMVVLFKLMEEAAAAKHVLQVIAYCVRSMLLCDSCYLALQVSISRLVDKQLVSAVSQDDSHLKTNPSFVRIAHLAHTQRCQLPLRVRTASLAGIKMRAWPPRASSAVVVHMPAALLRRRVPSAVLAGTRV